MRLEDNIVDVLRPLGEIIEFTLAPKTRSEFISRYATEELTAEELSKHYKKDIVLEQIVERLEEGDIFYIESREGKKDELYYFYCNGNYFHGDKIWSKYHPFAMHLDKIPVSDYIEEKCWFVGTRDNYTHQIVDFLPNLLMLNEYREKSMYEREVLIFGRNNSIFDACSDIPVVRSEIKERKSIKLSETGKSTAVGAWNIRRVRFKSLTILRFISIFKAYKLIDRYIVNSLDENQERKKNKDDSRQRNLLYLRRTDNRVKNQDSIENLITNDLDGDIASELHKLSFAEKKKLFGLYENILMPPGSENINGLCFARPTSRLYQLINGREKELLRNPFYSISTLRYLIPFLDRIKLIPSIVSEKLSSNYDGEWSTSDIRKSIRYL
tara:strand:- start:65 stop:1213 length:1149 start_codon:yes stop_codon:yes gene_type:complete